jgi:hypothetical protein
MIVVQELTDDLEYVEIGRIERGEITEGEDVLTAIDDEEVWTQYDADELERRFDGPHCVATEVDDDEDDDDQQDNQLSSGQATGRVRRHLAVPDAAIPIKDRSEAPEGAQIIEGERGGLYYLPGADADGEETGDVEPSANDAEPDEIANAISSDVLDRPSGELEDLRTQLRGAGSIEEAHDILERELDPGEIDELGAEIEQQQDFDLMPTSERLTDAFDLAETQESFRDRGGKGGNSTADAMQVLEYEDGSVDYATPVDAYRNVPTGVVSSPYEAQRNNRLSPKVINQLGGTAAEAVVTEGPDGQQFIVKEGMEGKTHAEFKGMFRLGFNILGKTDDPEALQDSARETLTSAYFTGNTDLHPGNLYIDTETNTYSIIDHDSAMGSSGRGIHNIDDYVDRPGLELDSEESRAMIYDKAIDIREGNVEIDGIDDNSYAGYIEDAADTAARRGVLEGHDFGGAEMPEELRSPPDDIDSIDDLAPDDGEGISRYDINVVNDFGEIKRAELVVPGTGVLYEPEVEMPGDTPMNPNPYTENENVPLINRLTAIREQ